MGVEAGGKEEGGRRAAARGMQHGDVEAAAAAEGAWGDVRDPSASCAAAEEEGEEEEEEETTGLLGLHWT